MIDLEDTARSPPAATFVVHGLVNAPASRRFGVRVVGDGAREEDWRRQLEGIEGVSYSEAMREARGGRNGTANWRRSLGMMSHTP